MMNPLYFALALMTASFIVGVVVGRRRTIADPKNSLRRWGAVVMGISPALVLLTKAGLSLFAALAISMPFAAMGLFMLGRIASTFAGQRNGPPAP
jgi:choline-glycine betaine transporter